MTETPGQPRFAAASASMVLLQAAACRAQIGCFAMAGRETPLAAARLYRATLALGAGQGR